VNYIKFTNGQDIIRPDITRFATNFFSLESLMRQTFVLRDMWESHEWLNSRLGRSKDEAAIIVHQLVLSSTKQALLVWKRADKILKLFEPLVSVLRLVHRDDKPTMGYMYEAMEQAKLGTNRKLRHTKTDWEIIDNR